MGYSNLNGRDSLAGLDSYITREEPVVLADDIYATDPREQMRALYAMRNQADSDAEYWNERAEHLQAMILDAKSKLACSVYPSPTEFWNRRLAELCKQAEAAAVELGRAWREYDFAANSIRALDQ